MLFVALTQSSILHRLPGGLARESRVSPHYLLSWVTDDFFSQWSNAEGETAVWESLLGHPNNRRDGVSFVEARLSPAQQVLQVIKSSVSGRPVYYSVNSRNEFFLSTHIALLRQAGVPIEEDPEVLPELLVYRTVAPPRTLYRGIRQMRVAGRIVVQVKDGNLRVSDASDGYNPPESANIGSEGEVAGRVAGTLTRAVDKLASVAPRVATLLSGGVDSSILSVIARDRLSTPDTYSTSYPHDDFEENLEQKYALSAAQALGTRHTLFAPTATDFLTGFIEALAAAEAPLNHLQSILLHLLFKHAIPEGSDRVICGEAADSVFGLETHFALGQPPSLRRRFLALAPVYLGLRAVGSGWARAQTLAAHIAQMQRLRLPITDPSHPIWSYSAYGDFGWVQNHYGASREEVIASRCKQLQSVANRPFSDVLAIYALSYCDVAVTTSIWSKLAEGQRKILYFPFASQDILDCAFSISWEIKLKRSKHVIREVGRRLGVPGFILNRRKQSFGIVSTRWAEKGGTLEPLIAVAAKVVDIKQLRDLQGTDPNKAMTLWSLLNYAVLKRLFVMGQSKESLLEELRENCSGKDRN
jgi:asparagine synthetase B (glutamine-hydrolysing)